MKTMLGIALALMGVFGAGSRADACSSFLLESQDRAVMGKSYDWIAGHGALYVNKRNVEKTAALLDFVQEPMSWVSQYGSISFSQFGQEFPVGGMNDQGLMVEILWLNSSEYPEDAESGLVNELQWIQYMLDTASDVSEAVENSSLVQVVPTYAPVHYLVCDAQKYCATFEYIDGDLVVHDGSQVSAKALTNSTYEDSMGALPRYIGFGGNASIPQGFSSMDRFIRTASNIRQSLESGAEATMAKGFEVLEDVESSETQWQIVYDPSELKVLYKVAGVEGVAEVAMDDFDFSCKLPVLLRDLRGEILGQVDEFVETTYERNLKHLRIGNRSIGYPVPEAQVLRIAAYPSTLSCQDDAQ